MKRLYVKPKYRENKLGKKLVLEILEYAKKAGYKEMVLDTIIPLQSAIHLYKKVGFVEREAYYHNPMDDVLYFKKITLSYWTTNSFLFMKNVTIDKRVR